jgi:hypothetical protein
MGMHGINCHLFVVESIDEGVRLGDLEVSGGMMAHLVHVHGLHCEVHIRNNAAKALRDQGLRDTVVVEEPAEFLVRLKAAWREDDVHVLLRLLRTSKPAYLVSFPPMPASVRQRGSLPNYVSSLEGVHPGSQPCCTT